METRTYPGIGSVSEGTMRPEDLIPAFADVLRMYAPGVYATLAELYLECFDTNTEWDDIDIETQSDCVSALFDAMDEIAPPFCSFGASEGDGACYGFWPDVEGLNEAARWRDGVVKVEAGDDWGYLGAPAEFCICREPIEDRPDYVMSVSDHGNVTLYDARTRKEIWSVV